MPVKTIRLRECGELQCGQVDETRPVISRVKILGWESKNRRRYLPESVQDEEYADKVINLNHPGAPNQSRRVEDRFGWFEDISRDDSGLWGNLHYNPKHPYAEQFAWLAKNKPSLVGMSHDAVGQGRTENGVFIVEKIISVKSVDLVADPATTKGLYESMNPDETPVEGGEEKLDDLETHIKNAVGAICADSKLDLKEKAKKIKAALKILEEPEGEREGEKEKEGEKGDEGEKERKAEESLKSLVAKVPGVKKLVEELDALKARLALEERHKLAHRLCEDARLPSVAVSEVFLAQLIEARGEKAMRELVEDRKALARVQKPRSCGPDNKGLKESQMDNKQFSKVLREGR